MIKHALSRRISVLSILTAGLAATACEEDKPGFMVAPNVRPTAKINAPQEIGLGDLARFDGAASRDPDGVLAGYAWSFGDGAATASTAVAFHAYNELGSYIVQLEVTDSRGATATATAAITVTAMPANKPPVARIIAPTAALPNAPITLDGTTSTDEDGQIVSYEWTLGAGGPTTRGIQVSHTFVAPGSYDVVLEVTDDRGARSTATHTIDVGMPMANLPPVANAGLDQTVGVGAAVMLDGSASFDPDGSITSYVWSFGDGGTGNGATVMHTYNIESSFVVTLTVTDDEGLTATDTATITTGQQTIDGLYTMTANPAMQSCGGLPATFVGTTLRFITTGPGMLRAETPDPENAGGPPIALTGTITGATWTVSGSWTDSQGGTHDFSITGTFSGTGYTATMSETVSIIMITLCTINWNLSGDYLSP